MNEDRSAMTPIDSPRAVLALYSGIDGEDVPLAAITGSLINQAWRIGKPPRFVLQLVAPQFDDVTNAHIEAVGELLRRHGIAGARLQRTAAGALSVPASAGRRWRLLHFISGDSVHRLPSLAHAESAAAFLARFHDALLDSTEGAALPNTAFHDTPVRMRRMGDVLAACEDDDARRLGDAIQAAWRSWQASGPASPLPLRPGHGDTKISNFLFSPGAPDAIALIDLDTLAQYELDAELGDAARSWCNRAGEDNAEARLDDEIFAGLVRGYLSTSRTIRPDERQSIVYGVGRITLELASRFCCDAVECRYFAWDPAVAPEARAHNLLRAQGQLRLAQDVIGRRAALERIVAAI